MKKIPRSCIESTSLKFGSNLVVIALSGPIPETKGKLLKSEDYIEVPEPDKIEIDKNYRVKLHFMNNKLKNSLL